MEEGEVEEGGRREVKEGGRREEDVELLQLYHSEIYCFLKNSFHRCQLDIACVVPLCRVCIRVDVDVEEKLAVARQDPWADQIVLVSSDLAHGQFAKMFKFGF